MKRIVSIVATLLAACALPPPPSSIDPSLQRPFVEASKRREPPAPPAVEQALLPPLRMEMPQAEGQPIDQRFDLSVNNAPAAQVFASLVSGTRYSMLLHPGVTGNITINLKDVTLREALDSLRELYGYEYKFEGTRIFVQPAGIQARVFQVNYLAAQRRGLSQLRVTASNLSDVQQTGTSGTTGVTNPALTGSVGVGASGAAGLPSGAMPGGAPSRDSTRVTTNQEALFWADLCEALVAIAFPPAKGEQLAPATAAAASATFPATEDRQRSVCNRRHAESDRSIVVSPHSGVIVVRATPAELRAVEDYLRATRLAVERQVMLEAKIIEVTLADQFQSGINWAIFGRSGGTGQLTRQAGQTTDTTTSVTQQLRTAATNQILGNPAAPNSQILTGSSGAVLGLAVAGSHFAALLTFLETQGSVQVLSSPRVATLNNQKAVLKVGQDQLFVSNVQVTPPTTTAGTITTQTTIAPQFSPYFSGIVLDVTPQIDDAGNITLHIHPTINDVTQNVISLDLGSQGGNINVPTAKNTIRETDTIVRVADGNIVAIGGLMRTEVNDVRGGIPGTPESGPLSALFRSTNRVVEKKELVILLKPTVVASDRDWVDDVRESRERVESLDRELGARGPR